MESIHFKYESRALNRERAANKNQFSFMPSWVICSTKSSSTLIKWFFDLKASIFIWMKQLLVRRFVRRFVHSFSICPIISNGNGWNWILIRIKYSAGWKRRKSDFKMLNLDAELMSAIIQNYLKACLLSSVSQSHRKLNAELLFDRIAFSSRRFWLLNCWQLQRAAVFNVASADAATLPPTSQYNLTRAEMLLWRNDKSEFVERRIGHKTGFVRHSKFTKNLRDMWYHFSMPKPNKLTTK